MSSLSDEDFHRLLAARLRAGPSAAGMTGTAVWPVSAYQYPIVIAEQMFPGSLQYLIAQAYQVGAGVDVAALTTAVQHVADRHHVLRAVLKDAGGELAWHRVDEPLAAVRREETMLPETPAQWMARVRHQGFDLWNEPPFRAHLAERPAGERLLALVANHAAVDGMSWAILERELSDAYERVITGHGPERDVPQYAEYVDWSQGREGTRQWLAAEQYWLRALASPPAPLRLPDGRARPARRTSASAQYDEALPAGTVAAVDSTARRYRVTRAAVFLAATGYTLSRITGREDLIIGVPVSDRGDPRFRDTIGMFVNTVPVRLQFGMDAEPGEVIRRTGEEFAHALVHSFIPNARIVELVKAPYTPDTTPLVQALFSYQDFGRTGLVLGDSTAEIIHLSEPATQFDLSMIVGDGTDGAFLRPQWNPDVVTEAVIRQLTRAFHTVLEWITGTGEATGIPEIPVIPSARLAAAKPGGATVPTLPALPTVPRAAVPAGPGSGEPAPGVIELVKGVWSEVLDIPLNEITADADFFELGGDSLLAARLKARLRRRGAAVPLSAVFDFPRFTDLIRQIEMDGRFLEER